MAAHGVEGHVCRGTAARITPLRPVVALAAAARVGARAHASLPACQQPLALHLRHNLRQGTATQRAVGLGVSPQLLLHATHDAVLLRWQRRLRLTGDLAVALLRIHRVCWRRHAAHQPATPAAVRADLGRQPADHIGHRGGLLLQLVDHLGVHLCRSPLEVANDLCELVPHLEEEVLDRPQRIVGHCVDLVLQLLNDVVDQHATLLEGHTGTIQPCEEVRERLGVAHV
mmetsp:Transcript_83150/g.231364  ORF Transcript_83150/g.231364 Transcript_83150/m.231364 type:complete len:228 (+) Transcript_83150:32-715(+)